MAKPSPTSLYDLFHDVVDACAFNIFFIGNTLAPGDSEDSTKRMSFNISKPASRSPDWLSKFLMLTEELMLDM